MLNPNRPYWRKEIDDLFNKVKAKLHAEAQKIGGGTAIFTDCYTGKELRGGDAYDYEHIRSAEEIFMQYRDRLTNEQIAEVVNCEANVKVTLRLINQSKGKRTFEEWCTSIQVDKYNINLPHAQASVRQADLGIQKAIKKLL
ncbi:MAG: hypothetical protein LBE34_14380 [Flavobacteriaceae bacterium]|jgi:hypothetical protein|nr:hypothetical protein [Flavobacteriaceae bacterium]